MKSTIRRQTVKPARFTFEQRDAIRVLLDKIGDDGHTIWAETIFDHFLTDALGFRERFARIYTSDGSPKGSIYDGEGRILPGIKGVYGLHVLRALACDLGAGESSALGRGFEARELTRGINAKLDTAT